MVAVLLPVFQGELYLATQIESILKQSFAHFRLYIRDDGSTDSSLHIAKSYARFDPRVEVIDSNLERLGVTQGIKKLLSHVQDEVVFFADQDDYWEPHKMEVMLAKLPQGHACDRPAVVFSNLVVANQNLGKIHESYWELAGIHPDCLTFRHIIRRNCVTGCAAAINKPGVDLAREMPDNVLHDWWLATLAAHRGQLLPIHEPLVWYRQHERNAIGAAQAGWAKMLDLVHDPQKKPKYAQQLHASIVHLKEVVSHDYFKYHHILKFFVYKEIIRRKCILWAVRKY